MDLSYNDFRYGFMFSFGQVFIFIIFCIVIGTFIYRAIKGLSQWNKNNNSPVLEVKATVVSKRADVSHNVTNTGENNMMHSSTTYYYITFEVNSGDRMEFSVTGEQYGMLAEGDYGTLTFQGTRYKCFLREKN